MLPDLAAKQSCSLGAPGSMAKTMRVQQGTRRKVSGASAAVAMPSKPPAETEYDRLSEVEVWLRLQRLLEVAKQKQGEVHDTPQVQQYPSQQPQWQQLSSLPIHCLQQLVMSLGILLSWF